jgi:tetratricopeptide (TPR) repeat protein
VEAGDLKSAEQLYSAALQKGKDRDREKAIALEGYLYTLMANGKQAQVFEEAGKYVDGDLAPIAFFRMGEAKLSLNDKDGAVAYCRKAVDRAETFEESFAADMLQKMYSLLGDKEVRTYCEEKLRADPDSAIANLTMFNLTRLSGEYNKAISYIDKCLQLMGTDSPHKVKYIMKKAEVLQAAYIRTSDKDYLERTVKEYESLLAEMPTNTAVLNNLAYLLAENNQRLDKALEYAQRAYEAQPNNAGFLDTYAYALYKNGRFSEAAEFLQAALQRYEQDKVSVPTDVYEHLGMIKEGLGAADEALAAYKQALETATGTLPKVVEERIKTAVERLGSQNQGNESPQNAE